MIQITTGPNGETLFDGMSVSIIIGLAENYGRPGHGSDIQKTATLELAAAALRHLSAQNEWHPIETAPSDTDILLGWWRTWPEREWRTEAGWAAHSNRMPPESGASNGWRHGEATHWRPLPAPPGGEK